MNVLLVCTGAGLAVPFFLVGMLLRIRLVYVIIAFSRASHKQLATIPAVVSGRGAY